MHKSYEELQKEISEAENLIAVSATYRHNKSGGLYVVEGFSVLESTNEILVRYESKSSHIEFSRPFRQFIEQVSLDGKIISRFEKI